MIDRDAIRAMTNHYLVTALWSSIDHDENDGDWLDSTYTVADVAPESVRAARRDCMAFYAETHADHIGVWEDPQQVGHDFWLTRNGHGTGFWDRHYGSTSEEAAAGERMTDASRPYGSCDAYVGADGRVYLS